MVSSCSIREDAIIQNVKGCKGDLGHGLEVGVIHKTYLTSHVMHTINTVVANNLHQSRKSILPNLDAGSVQNMENIEKIRKKEVNEALK